jgi:hypothetical protein
MNIVERANSLIQPLGSMINLVTFDAIDLTRANVTTTVDPLYVLLSFPIISNIPKELHTYLRQAIRDYVKQKELYAGEIKLEYVLTIKLYAKRRITPAWTPD